MTEPEDLERLRDSDDGWIRFPEKLHLGGIRFAVQAPSKRVLRALIRALTEECGHPHNFAVAQSDLRIFVSATGALCLEARGARVVPLPGVRE